jgi:uncharacterized protein YigE (DUF2233 family)
MKLKHVISVLCIIALIVIACYTIIFILCSNPKIHSKIVDTEKVEIKMFHRDQSGNKYTNIQELIAKLNAENESLLFAINGGMFDEQYNPLGLYIENGKVIHSVNRHKYNHKKTTPNFYLEPNGIFFIDINNQAYIAKTRDLKNFQNIKFATQSGPMLLTNNEINKIFKPESNNCTVRNGVGILPNNKVLFAISSCPVNFYEFALYFKKAGCINALFLDGYISKAYIPEKDLTQTKGNLGVIIGITKQRPK